MIRRATSEGGRSLDLAVWIPYRCWVVASRVSACLARMYGERFGMTVPGWRVMAVLGRYQPLSGKEVAEKAAMDQVQVTRAINHLVGRGLVNRRSDRTDRRRVALRLSARGRRAYDEIVPLARAIERVLLDGLNGTERRWLAHSTDKIFRRAERVLGDGADWRRFL